MAYIRTRCAHHPLVLALLYPRPAAICHGRTRDNWASPPSCPQCPKLHNLSKMWGPGAEQGGILQTSAGKFELKEPYYRLSQPTWIPEQQQQQPPMPSQPGFSPRALEDGDATILLQMSESPDNLLNQ